MDLFTREIYLDIETLRLSNEVEGGWSSIRRFGVAVAVTWDKEHAFRSWFESDVSKLVEELDSFTLITTFNGNRFDFEVLRGYTPVDHLMKRSFDVHEVLHKLLGHRIKLDQLAKDTLGNAKTGSGIDAVQWWREGKKEKVIEYCQMDVALLRDVVDFGRAKGYVIVGGRQVRVSWD
ncbi:MAG: ribonuclease H-like domain-containing protein [Candidatus Acidiferrales bacterium]